MSASQNQTPQQDLVSQYENLRQRGSSPQDAWKTLKEEFTQKYQGADPEQAWKTASGRAFEQIVQREIKRQMIENKQLDNLEFCRWYEIKSDSVKRILSETLWRRGSLKAYQAESEVDFVAYEVDRGKPKRVVAVYSCKVSLRERFQQDLYWAERFRSRGIRFCFVTLDNDGVLTKAVSQKKLASKQAKMAAALYDRVYLLTSKALTPFSVFRSLDQLVSELEQWLKCS